jgi:hypothetical protein
VTAAWVVIAALALATAALRLAGPLALGGRPQAVRALSVVGHEAAPMIVVVLGAAAVTALARLLSWGAPLVTCGTAP